MAQYRVVFYLPKHIEESFAETQYLHKYKCSRYFINHMTYELFCKYTMRP